MTRKKAILIITDYVDWWNEPCDSDRELKYSPPQITKAMEKALSILKKKKKDKTK